MADTTPGKPNSPSRTRSDEIELEPWYRDGNDDIVEPDRVTQQTQYFWKHWVRLLGVGPAALLVRLRMYCYFNRESGERRNFCFPSQHTLAEELGVGDRKTIRRWLQRLEEFDFIRGKKRNRWSAEHGRPVRTTNTYRVKMWDPVVPEHEGKAFVQDAERVLNEPANPLEIQGLFPEGQNAPLRDLVPVNNSPRGQNAPLVAGAKRDSGRSTLKNVTNVNVHGATRTEDDELRIQDLAQQMVEQLGDPQSRNFYRRVAEKMPEHLVYMALSETKDAKRSGQVKKSPGAYFTHVIKKTAEQIGVKLLK